MKPRNTICIWFDKDAHDAAPFHAATFRDSNVNGRQESACGWRKDRWGLSWQVTPRALTEGGAEAERAIAAMVTMRKIDLDAIDGALHGRRGTIPTRS